MQKLKFHQSLIAAAVAATLGSGTAWAQLEEVIVTAQKVAESIQDIPIAVSAFSQDQLDSALINDTLNLQFNVPNMLMTKQNFSSSDVRIRGIGAGAIGAAGDNGVGIHLNGSYLNNSRIFETQFYDTERVEVLRGPQGTLYGRNTTGGVVNIITAKAKIEDEMSGHVDVGVGNYGHKELRGHVNVPINENLAARGAVFYQKRDGFIDNLYTGNDIDDRDMYSARLSLTWTPSENTDVNFMAQYFEEDDSRSRSQKQACNHDDTGILGCLPGKLRYETSHTAGGIAGSLLDTINAISAGSRGVLGQFGLLTGGAYGNSALLANLGAAFPRDGYALDNNPDDVRKVSMDFEPQYYADETNLTLEVNHDFGKMSLTSITGYSDSKLNSQEDYEKGVASESWSAALGALADLGATPALPCSVFCGQLTALGAGSLIPFITDAATGIPGVGLWAGNPALVQLGAGVPVLLPNDKDTILVNNYYGADSSGGEFEQWTQELRLASSFDGKFNFMLGAFYLNFENELHYVVRNSGLVLPGLILPINLTDAGMFPAPVGDPNNPKSRSNPHMLGYDNDTRHYELETWAIFGEVYYDLTDSLKLTLGGRYTDEEKTAEQRTLYVTFADIPNRANNGYFYPEYQAEESSWKVNLTWTATDDLMMYATVSSSFKSGGFNPISPTSILVDPAQGGDPSNAYFEPEFIDAYEVGFKSTLLDGRAQFNASAFYYDYKDLQVSKIVDVTSFNENTDAEIMGLEAELLWAPTDRLRVTANMALLNTEIKDFATFNTADPNGMGTTEGVISCNGINYLYDGPATTGCSAGVKPTLAQGVIFDQTGNEIFGSPDKSLNVGLAYTLPVGNSMELLMSTNYYWQGTFYASNFNAAADKVDAWSVWNASTRLSDLDGKWYVEAWVKNIKDDESITGQYLTSSVSGLFTNQFILDPRTYGLTLGYNF